MRQATRAKLLVIENNSTGVLHPLYPPCPLTTPCVPTPHLVWRNQPDKTVDPTVTT